MKFVKLFGDSSSSRQYLTREINDWVKKHNVNVLEYKFHTTERGLDYSNLEIMVIYEADEPVDND